MIKLPYYNNVAQSAATPRRTPKTPAPKVCAAIITTAFGVVETFVAVRGLDVVSDESIG